MSVPAGATQINFFAQLIIYLTMTFFIVDRRRHEIKLPSNSFLNLKIRRYARERLVLSMIKRSRYSETAMEER